MLLRVHILRIYPFLFVNDSSVVYSYEHNQIFYLLHIFSKTRPQLNA